MKIYLKIKLATLVHESKLIRSKERHTLANARALAGRYPKKHSLGAEKPLMPVKVERAMQLENATAESQKAYELFWGLQHHRKNKVRKEARDTHIAIGFLNGRNYEDMEQDAHTEPNWNNIERMVVSYGTEDPRILKQKFEEWVQASKFTGSETI